MKIQLMTAGYEGQSQDEFVAKLLKAGVKRVIDTRFTPASRKKGLSKTPLAARLAEEGVDYYHLKELGTPKPWRDDYHKDHDFAKLARRYRPYLDEHLGALRTVFELASERPSVLICYEAEAHLCHRSLIAVRMTEVFKEQAAIEVIDL